jgi:dimethylargininase
MFAQHALVRRPSSRLAEGIVTHLERTPVDVAKAREQWEAYVDALHTAEWETHEVDPAEDHPDSMFVEDTMLVYGDLAVIARPGAEERRGETPAAERAVRELGYRIAHIEAPGTLDGGDVLKWGNTVWVGRSGRTNEEGIRQLARHLEALGARVVIVPVSKVLHLKSAVTALPDGTIIGHPPLVDDPGLFPSFLPVPEPAGSHVVLLGGSTVLMAASAPETVQLFRDRGLEVLTVDISEFEKVEGSVTCLSVRLRGLPAGS